MAVAKDLGIHLGVSTLSPDEAAAGYSRQRRVSMRGCPEPPEQEDDHLFEPSLPCEAYLPLHAAANTSCSRDEKQTESPQPEVFCAATTAGGNAGQEKLAFISDTAASGGGGVAQNINASIFGSKPAAENKTPPHVRQQLLRPPVASAVCNAEAVKRMISMYSRSEEEVEQMMSSVDFNVTSPAADRHKESGQLNTASQCCSDHKQDHCDVTATSCTSALHVLNNTGIEAISSGGVDQKEEVWTRQQRCEPDSGGVDQTAEGPQCKSVAAVAAKYLNLYGITASGNNATFLDQGSTMTAAGVSSEGDDSKVRKSRNCAAAVSDHSSICTAGIPAQTFKLNSVPAKGIRPSAVLDFVVSQDNIIMHSPCDLLLVTDTSLDLAPTDVGTGIMQADSATSTQIASQKEVAASQSSVCEGAVLSLSEESSAENICTELESMHTKKPCKLRPHNDALPGIAMLEKLVRYYRDDSGATHKLLDTTMCENVTGALCPDKDDDVISDEQETRGSVTGICHHLLSDPESIVIKLILNFLTHPCPLVLEVSNT
jgi:hypothetical protein